MSEGTKTFDVVQEIIGIKRRLEELERASKQPHIPRAPVLPGGPFQEHRVTCGKCGLSIGQVMAYCCPHSDCPCGLGGATCMAHG
jgi:hypothetical protein